MWSLYEVSPSSCRLAVSLFWSPHSQPSWLVLVVRVVKLLFLSYACSFFVYIGDGLSRCGYRAVRGVRPLPQGSEWEPLFPLP